MCPGKAGRGMNQEGKAASKVEHRKLTQSPQGALGTVISAAHQSEAEGCLSLSGRSSQAAPAPWASSGSSSRSGAGRVGLVPQKEPQCCALAVRAPERARENLEESEHQHPLL